MEENIEQCLKHAKYKVSPKVTQIIKDYFHNENLTHVQGLSYTDSYCFDCKDVLTFGNCFYCSNQDVYNK